MDLPDLFFEPGPRNLLWWQWLALPVVFLASWAAGYLLSRITRALLGRLVTHTRVTWDDVMLARVTGPIALAWTLAVLYAAVPLLALPETAQASLYRLFRSGLFLAFFWSLLRTIDILAEILRQSWARHGATASLIPLGRRVVKVVIVAMGVVAIISELGYPVASLVAGLGIGGLALALAAQKTVENLFGAFSIGIDQPFREGDFVRIDDFVGTIEAIGLRSTRVRTLDRTVITIPNGRLADTRLESFAVRDRIRLACTVGLTYATTALQLEEVLDGLERVLRTHPKIWPDAVIVRFKEFAASSLDIEVMAWFETADWAEFQLIRQEILLHFMEVVARAGSSFAFPTRTIHLVAPGQGRAAVGGEAVAKTATS